jgi:hypothetical protein
MDHPHPRGRFMLPLQAPKSRGPLHTAEYISPQGKHTRRILLVLLLLSMSSPLDNGHVVESSSSDSPTLSDSGIGSAPPLPRRPIPRKGHTKSRRGCFNCKKRYPSNSEALSLLKYLNPSTEGLNATRDTLSATTVQRRDCCASIQQTSSKQCNGFLPYHIPRR